MLCSVYKLVCLLVLECTRCSDLILPLNVCVPACAQLIQDSAGRSRCKLVTQIHARCLAGSSNTPLFGPINSNHPVLSINKRGLPTLSRRHIHSKWHTHAHIREASQLGDSIYYVMISCRSTPATVLISPWCCWFLCYNLLPICLAHLFQLSFVAVLRHRNSPAVFFWIASCCQSSAEGSVAV